MAKVYGSSENKIQKIKNSNPAYWALCVSRSQYDESVIIETLNDIDQTNIELKSFLENAYDYLNDKDGEMNSRLGYATDNHKTLHNLLIDINYLSPSFSQNSHKNCFPVNTWKKEIKTLTNKMKKIQRVIDKL